MASRLDRALDSLEDEHARLKLKTRELTRGFRNEEILGMESGKPRMGADSDEEEARKCFNRMREIEEIITSHHGN